MNEQRIIWTVLPNGVSERLVTNEETGNDDPHTFLELSAYVSPRLLNPATGKLADYPEFVDWPATLNGLSFVVEFGTGQEFEVVPDPLARSDVWQAIVPPTTPVVSHVFDDHKNSIVHSYPMQDIASFIQQQYAEVAATSGAEHPATQDISNAINQEIGVNPEELEFDFKPALSAQRDRGGTPDGEVLWDSGGAIPATSSEDDQKNLKDTILAMDFLQQQGYALDKSDGVPSGEPPAPQTPDLDFHQIISAAGQYPTLLRAMGLVLDFRIDVTLESIPADETTIGLRVSNPMVDAPPAPPSTLTRCKLGPGVFRPLARAEGARNGGYLIVNSDRGFTPIHLDVDGAILKLNDFAAAVAALENSEAPDAPKNSALPALRSGGIALTRRNNAMGFVNSLNQQLALNNKLAGDEAVIFDAEDITRGLRIDVREPVTNRWHSLMQRTGKYTIGKQTLPAPIELADSGEGYISTAPSSDFEQTSGHLYLPESLLVWDGYSLVVRRPGKVVGIDTAVDDTPEEPSEKDVDVEPEFVATRRTLPVLRFGRTYELRARVVDLAGNSTTFDPSSNGGVGVSDPVRYGRFEPVSSPTILLHQPRGEAESVDRIVLYNDNSDPRALPKPNARHVAPPKIPVALAELHGLLDRTTEDGRVGPDPSKYTDLATLDRGGFFMDDGTASDDSDLIDHPQAISDPNGHKGTFHYPHDEVEVNYLPDPAAVGASFLFLPGTSGLLNFQTLMAFETSAHEQWPVQRAFRLVLRDGPADVVTDNDARVMAVSLPPAGVVTARVSSFLGADNPLFDHFALWHWIESRPNSSQLFIQIALGRHWMFTPYSELTFVHAVKVPLAAPVLELEQPSRQKGDTHVDISGELTFDRKSTGRVDVRAAWVEPLDGGPGKAEPSEASTEQVAFSFHADRVVFQPLPNHLAFLLDRHDLPDTKHRFITYNAEATTRFAEYFVAHETYTGGTGNFTVELSDKGLVPGWLSVKSPDGQNVLSEGTDYTVDSDAGTITFRRGLDGDFDIAFLARPISLTSPEGQGWGMHILSTARPVPPKVHSVVPTFEWLTPAATPGTKRSDRKGGGLRIYLERPWWSSGSEERLGVLLITEYDSSSNPYPSLNAIQRLKPFTTMWGVDPIFESRALPDQFPTLDHLPSADGTSAAIVVPESPDNSKRFIAAHEVRYDEDTDMWYADVEFDTGNAYAPFVRMALVRYQPFAIGGCNLSTPVLADFIQMAPDRFLSVAPGSNASRRRITLSGPSYTKTSLGSAQGEAQVIVEIRDQKVSDADLGWTPHGNPVPLQPSSQRLGAPGALWTGEVQVPPGQVRLVVEQYEVLQIVPGEGTNAGCGPSKEPKSHAPVASRRRIVYSDIVAL